MISTRALIALAASVLFAGCGSSITYVRDSAPAPKPARHRPPAQTTTTQTTVAAQTTAATTTVTVVAQTVAGPDPALCRQLYAQWQNGDTAAIQDYSRERCR